MKAMEFGQQNQRVIFLLHGGGLSWWSYRDAISVLQRSYHLVVPCLDGHAGSDRPFTSIEDNAGELCRYIDERFGGKVFAVGGLSLGGQILTEMLSQWPDICECALIESALVIPMPLTNWMLGPSVKMSYGLIKKRWFARLQFNQLGIKKELFEDYYRDSSKISMADMLAFMGSNTSYTMKTTLSGASARVVVAVGEREQKKMRDSARLLHEALPDSRLEVLPRYSHGELSINNGEKYCELLLSQAE